MGKQSFEMHHNGDTLYHAGHSSS